MRFFRPRLHLPLALLALACAQADAPPRRSLPAGEYASQEWGLVGAVNDYRAKRRQPLLRWDAGLAAVARQHSRDMAEGRVPFSHQGFETRVAEARRLGYLAVAENLGTNNFPADTTVSVAMRGFLDSPPHRHAIEGPYERTGVGVARDLSGDFYFTQLFAR
ncbi:MAG TPA: CAP domain-containing protein [Longimicrobium sp.]